MPGVLGRLGDDVQQHPPDRPAGTGLEPGRLGQGVIGVQVGDRGDELVGVPGDPVVVGEHASNLDQLDGDLAVASVALGVARSSYARRPSAENARLVDRAVAAVDRLLDQRLAAGR